MVTTRDTPAKRTARRRQTRSGASDGEDTTEPLAEPVIVKRSTRRISVTTLDEPEPAAVTETASHHNHVAEPPVSHAHTGGYKGGKEGEREPHEKPAVSERIRATAAHVGEQVQDTVSSAMHKAGLNWRTLATLLLLAALTSWLTSRLAQPDLTKRQLSGIFTSIDQANSRYSKLLKELEAAQGQVQTTEDRLAQTLDKVEALEKQFAGGSEERRALNRGTKVDPNVILGLAEHRMEKLLSKFAADRTGLADYAVAPAGGKVVSHSRLAALPAEELLPAWRRAASALVPGAGSYVHPDADKFLLTPGGPVAGECLPLNGSAGWVELRLREPIEPLALSYEHLPPSIAYDPRSAPLSISVSGRLAQSFRFAPRGAAPLLGHLERRPGVGPQPLGEFVYDPSKGALNTVALDGGMVADHIRFQVNSNYGHLGWTCLYRIRVHGRKPDAEALNGLRTYKYKPAGYTLLDDIHQPFWNWVVELLPRWLAPNLITLSGIFGLAVAYFVSAYYVPSFSEFAPWWAYFLNGAAGLIYLHLDCIDGKQARRTGSSSPLGQLFDHGCDALNVHLAVTCIGTSIAPGFTAWTVLGVMSIMVPWLLAHWEEYHSGIMLYGNGYWGVTEANYLMVLLHIFTAAAGPGVWQLGVEKLLHVRLPWPLPHDLAMKHALLLAVSCFALQQMSGQLWRVFVRGVSGQMPEDEKGHKQLGRGAAAGHLAQLALLLLLGVLVMGQPWPSVGQWRAVFGGYGVIYALQASKLIMDHMAKEPFELTWWPILAMVLLLANSRVHAVDSAVATWTFAAVVVAGYLHYVMSVINEICAFLGIRCLTIKPTQE